METKVFQNHLSKLTGCLSKLTFGPIWLHFGSILVPFWLHFGVIFAATKKETEKETKSAPRANFLGVVLVGF